MKRPLQRILFAAILLSALPIALIPSAGGQSQVRVELSAGGNYAIAGGDSFSVIGFSTDGTSATLQLSIASPGNAPSLSLAQLSKGQVAFLSASSVSFLDAAPSADGTLLGTFLVSSSLASGRVSPAPDSITNGLPSPSPTAATGPSPSGSIQSSPILVLKAKLLAGIESRRPATPGESVKFRVDISTCPHKLPGPCLYASRFGTASYETAGGSQASEAGQVAGEQAPAVTQATGGVEAAAAGKASGGRQVAHFTTGYFEVYDKTGRKLGAWGAN